MHSVTSSEAVQQDNDLQPFVHNTISSNRKTLNVTGQTESLIVEARDYDSKSVGHRRQHSDRKSHANMQKRHSVKRNNR